MSAADASAAERVLALLQRGDAVSAANEAARLRAQHANNADLAQLHGVALLMLGRPADARVALQESLRLDPGNTSVQANLASALLGEGRAGEAIAILRRAIAAQPGDAALHNNLGNALRASGDDAGAREAYRAALARVPDDFNATLNLAATELALGAVVDAEMRLRAVLARQPHPQALLLLGNVLHRQQRYAQAQAAFEQGAQLAPQAAQFPYQAGLMADEQRHYADAARLYRRALQLDPTLHLAEGQLLFVARRQYDWATAEPLARRVKARALDGSGAIDPFAFLAEDATPAEQLACARARAARVERDSASLRQRVHFTHGARKPGALRVGYVSAGFHAHATTLLVTPMFEQLGQRDDLELHLYATTPDDGSDARRRLRRAAHALHEVATQPSAAIAQQIHAAGIDVLVDVDGWCDGGRPELFALRPAPVQATWLAYPGSTGASFIDYLIADRFLIPDSSRQFCSEAVAWLPRCYQPSDPARPIETPPPRSAFGLPDEAVVFASFNNSWKLNAASFARMCAVLRGVPGSVLWLLDAGGDAATRLREAARAHGVDGTRLVFSPALPHIQHLARYEHADLFLDTNPYNAHTTASDAIWAGCPVLTRPGETFESRVAGSINHHLGMPELIARDDDDFIAIATRLGNDRTARAALRERLATQRTVSGLFDMQGYARDFAALLHAMATRGPHLDSPPSTPT